MSHLSIFQADRPSFAMLSTSQAEAIVRLLSEAGVIFRRWPVDRVFPADAEPGEILDAWRLQIHQLQLDEGYTTTDVIRVTPDHPDRVALRQKFLAEHTHSEDEVRFFVAGSGVFYLHLKGFVYRLTCTAGDLVSVPAGAAHWFDMGPEPDFTAIRLFTNPEGWVANFTGSDLARFFPSPYEQQATA